MVELIQRVTERLSIGPESILLPVLALAVAVLSGGGLSRRAVQAIDRFSLLSLLGIAAALTGRLAVEMAAGAVVVAVVLWCGLGRRGALRLALIGFGLGWLGNIAVITANGAMPVKDETGDLRVATEQRHRYELLTGSTKLAWLADTITVPVSGGLASPGDVLLSMSVAVGIVAIAHSPDGRGGTGRRRRRAWHQARFDAALEAMEVEAARAAATAGARAWPDEARLRWNAVTLAMAIDDHRAAADEAVAVLADLKLGDEDRARCLEGHAVALVMDGDATTLHVADNALLEAEALLPGDAGLALSRALLDLRRGHLDEAAARARLVLEREAPGEHSRARAVLLDTLLARHQADGRAAPELLGLLPRFRADSSLPMELHHVCALAAYQSHADDHAAAITLMRDAARSVTTRDEDSAAAITYHLAYVLARSSDAEDVPEIDRLLGTLPKEYPSAPARSHTDALRNLASGDPDAALAATSRTLESGSLTPAQSAEVHLTRATALAALGRHPEAVRSRAEAIRQAPHHQLLADLVGVEEGVVQGFRKGVPQDRPSVRQLLPYPTPTSASTGGRQ